MTTTEASLDQRQAVERSAWWGPARTPIAVWALLVVTGSLLAVPFRTAWKVKAPPLTGAVDWPFLPATAAVLAFGLWLAAHLPGWCAQLRWRRLLAVTALVALAWGSALALTRGPSGLDRGLEGRFEYPAVVAQVDAVGIGRFVDSFTDPVVLERYPVHVEGHPIGAALLFWGLDRIGLGGAAGGAAFVLLIGATTGSAVVMTVREVAGERCARQAAPFLILAPAVIWTVTSADAVYAAVGAWAVTLLVLAARPGRPVRSSQALAVAGGLVFAIGTQLSYGLAPLALVALTVIAARRRWSLFLGAGATGAAVMALSAALGFWWFDGLHATHVRYLAGIGSQRPYAYFAPLGNPAAFAVALGPAVAVAMAHVRDRRLWLLAGAGLAAALLADLTGLSKAEVERIWLPFAPWVLVLTAGLADLGRVDQRPPSRRPWDWSPLAGGLLAVQVAVAVAAESVVKTLW